jgi:hypothetical protein
MHGNIKHGQSRPPSRMYQRWRAMKQRCNNPLNRAYRWYGARGITVCERWERSFGLFLLDMGEAPEGYWIDRMENDGGYEPENCRWATPGQSARNSRKRQRRVTPEHRKAVRRAHERRYRARKKARDPAAWKARINARAARARARKRGVVTLIGSLEQEKRTERARKAALARWQRPQGIEVEMEYP